MRPTLRRVNSGMASTLTGASYQITRTELNRYTFYWFFDNSVLRSPEAEHKSNPIFAETVLLIMLFGALNYRQLYGWLNF
jgi:hypothetical protein